MITRVLQYQSLIVLRLALVPLLAVSQKRLRFKVEGAGSLKYKVLAAMYVYLLNLAEQQPHLIDKGICRLNYKALNSFPLF